MSECDADIRNVHTDHAASHIGKAQGVVTLIRAVHYHARKNNVYLPRDLMIKVNVHTQCITLTTSLRVTSATRHVVLTMCACDE